MSDPYSREITVQNPEGIHARPCLKIVELANQFESELYLEKNELRVDGKNILGILSLAASFGSKIRITASGPDSEQAVESMAELISHPFHYSDKLNRNES